MNGPQLKRRFMVISDQLTNLPNFSGSHERWQIRSIGFQAVRRGAIGMSLFGLIALSFVGCQQKTADRPSSEAKSRIVSSPVAKTQIDTSPAVKAQTDTSPIVKAQTETLPAVKAQTEAAPNVNAQIEVPPEANGQIEAVPDANEPNATPTAVKFSDLKPNEIFDRTVPIVDENGVTFVPAQLHKNSSLLVLAFESDIRADFVVMTARTILNPAQMVLAKQMALSYEDQFKELARQRAAILETATDDNDVDRQVLKVQMKLATLLRQIRTRINAEIMTQDQRYVLGCVFLEKMAEKAIKEKADAKNRPKRQKRL
jgi:hypothetical protein